MPDKRAKDILFKTHWKNGWISEGRRRVEPADLAYAKSKNYMFDAIYASHDQAVSQLLEERERADLAAASSAFLASLGTRRMDLRSALGSFAFAANFPRHEFSRLHSTLTPSGARCCKLCGLYERGQPAKFDLNVLNFERHKWGGVRRDDPIYAWLDLRLFREEALSSPTDSDRRTLVDILKAAHNLSSDDTVGTLEKMLMGKFASSKAERQVLIEILAVIGILQPRNRSGYFGEFTFAFDRKHTGQHFNDWGYPAIWWRGSDGVNDDAVASYFPDL